jgi:hypothetical protein
MALPCLSVSAEFLRLLPHPQELFFLTLLCDLAAS